MYKYLALLLALTACRQEPKPVNAVTENPTPPRLDSTAIKQAAHIADSIFSVGLQQLKTVNQVKIPPLNLQIGEIKAGKRWQFDRYPGNTRTEIPDSGYVFLSADIHVTSTEDDPRLPPICLYKVGDQSLEIVDAMTWMFYGWKNEQAFLGNTKDEGNLLGPGRTVRFSPGLAIREETMKNKVLILVVHKSLCMKRTERKFDNPPLFYDAKTCRAKGQLSLKELAQNYEVLKIFNQQGI
jgi:hypothetical protein